ncbi:HAD family hydrolase [Helicobacter sp. 11S02596-1]|uniref:HAD family hydrolase n=1 Tax=Helicobacter sp. 11S02596-1 TaxID=1476194 RepID=UPI000BA65F3D|nr:HAD family hydrolase [Helicobacter sp. 11S02596-1]PAF43608.1 hypothetical protein BJI48_04970 [Helicobacter sp. 11S02596-1]
MEKEKIILFDLDGTLIDSEEAIYESCCVACEKNALKIPALEEVQETIGHTLSDMFLHFGASREKLGICIEVYRHHYKGICLEKTKMLPKATDSILLANEFAYLGVVTTKTARFSRAILEHLGILGYFQTIVGIEDVEFPKPHQEPVLKAIARMGASLSNAFMIGDTILDIQSAISAGISPIGVKTGYGNIQAMQAICENIFDDSLEAVGFIKSV